jgi:RNase P subunit RPR2
MSNKRDFIYVQGNTIYVIDHCKSCGSQGTTHDKTFSHEDGDRHFTMCDNCGDAHFPSIRKARESYPTAYIEMQIDNI